VPSHIRAERIEKTTNGAHAISMVVLNGDPDPQASTIHCIMESGILLRLSSGSLPVELLG
jgi:hypothetical protein